MSEYLERLAQSDNGPGSRTGRYAYCLELPRVDTGNFRPPRQKKQGQPRWRAVSKPKANVGQVLRVCGRKCSFEFGWPAQDSHQRPPNSAASTTAEDSPKATEGSQPAQNARRTLQSRNASSAMFTWGLDISLHERFLSTENLLQQAASCCNHVLLPWPHCPPQLMGTKTTDPCFSNQQAEPNQ